MKRFLIVFLILVSGCNMSITDPLEFATACNINAFENNDTPKIEGNSIKCANKTLRIK